MPPKTVLKMAEPPQLEIVSDFLTANECAALIRCARNRMEPSTVLANDGTGQPDGRRTSSGMFFECGELPIVETIEARVSEYFGFPLKHGEGMQVLRYMPGQEYQPHWDYFDEGAPGVRDVLKRGGQRVATVLMYLNTPESGGATSFPDASWNVSAIQGNAVCFRYPDPSPASLSLHGGSPVVAGEKWVATKWFRTGKFT